MQYYDQNDNKSRISGYIALGVYAVVLLCIFLFASFTIELPNADKGIIVDFGNTDTGRGATDVALSQPASKVSAPRPKAPKVEKEIVTSQNPDAPAVVEKPKTQPKPVKETVEPEPKPREVNKQALFPGRTVGSDAKSEGETDKAEGNQGKTEGTVGGAHADGGGTGNSGISFSLAGRTPIGRLGRPTYNGTAEGRVVIQIVVNAAGVVTSATYHPVGSTTDRRELVDAALKEARKARFNKLDDSSKVQTGTITYVFKLD